tara:strand:- start:196 stop:882 length:687 start_codon:yes stop_codon:yes gene_type:complete
MLIASGNVNMNSLIDGMIAMAKDNNISHEHNQRTGQGNWKHQDGWGIAFLRNNHWVLEKSPRPIYDDPKINRFRDLKTNLVIMHVRKKSVGDEIDLNNCHPFQHQDSIFCHNGTIKEKIFHHPQFQPQGTTDSERLFYSILSKPELIPGIEETLNSYQTAKGSNIILSTKNKSYIYIKENIFPLYYQMKVSKNKDFLIISSEELNKDMHWTTLEPKKVHVIDHGNSHT